MLIGPLVWVILAQSAVTPLTGTVVAPGGEPVVGADLILVGLPSFDPPIVARGKSGEGGRFSLDRPSVLAGDHHPQRAPILWVVRPGYRLSATRFPEALPGPDQPVRVVLEPPGQAEVRVEGPEGQPLSEVRVLPGRLRTHYTNIPDAVAELVAATTGADGRAILDGVAPAELAYADFQSREFGIQGRFIAPSSGKPAVIALRPVATWKGRLVAQDPAAGRGWRVRAWTNVGGDPNAEPQTTGYVETTTDDEGRFALDPIALGGLRLDLKPPRDLAVLVDLPQNLAVLDRGDQSVEIPLKKGVTVTGRFVVRGTGQPVAGISVSLIYLRATRNGSQQVKTDDQGRYTFQSFPGLVRVGHFTVPPQYVMAPGQSWEDFTVPEPPQVIELATREVLPAAPPLRGRVVDEAGRAVPAATVQASWMLTVGGKSSNGSVRTTADAEGNFVVEGLGPDSTVTIFAKLLDRQTPTSTKVQAGAANPLTVTITPTPSFAVAGRVVGPGGTPLGDISIRVEIRVDQNNRPGFGQQVQFDGNSLIKTSPDGSFLSPKGLERKPGEVRIEVNTRGFLPARSPWVRVGEGDLLTLPDLALKPVRNARIIAGRIIDRDGRPVPGAKVPQTGDGPAMATVRTNGEGRFRLTGVPSGPALVFAEAPGFRFGGSVLGGEAQSVDIRLARFTEPPVTTLRSLPSPLSRAEERAMARDLLGPVLPLAQAGTLGVIYSQVIPTLARVAPDQVLEMIENRTVAESSPALAQVVLAQFEDDPATAIATAEADLDPAVRATLWLALEGFRPRTDQARREGFLDRALADARLANTVPTRVQLLGRIADRWLDLGSVDRARPILLEGQALLADRPKDRYSFESEVFAESLAAIDLPAALAIFERRGVTNTSPPDAATISRHQGQAAVWLANLDPAAAERLIAPPSDQFYGRAEIILKVARKMAKLDPNRARRLVETIDDDLSPFQMVNAMIVPFGLGWIADGLAATDPAQARERLDEAFAGLRKLKLDGRPGQGQGSVANLMAELLPLVERLEPDRLAERVWLAAASRGPSVGELRLDQVDGTIALAMLIARYDRAVADVIVAPALERLPDLLGDLAGSYAGNIATTFKNLAAYDPRAVALLIRALPESAKKSPAKADAWTAPTLEAQFRLAAAAVLGVPVEARAREAGRVGDAGSKYRLDD